MAGAGAGAWYEVHALGLVLGGAHRGVGVAQREAVGAEVVGEEGFDLGLVGGAGHRAGGIQAASTRVSMSRKGECHDNAVAESVFATIKVELVHCQKFATRAAARAAPFEYMEVFYNRSCLHSTLGYQTPVEFEKQTSGELVG